MSDVDGPMPRCSPMLDADHVGVVFRCAVRVGKAAMLRPGLNMIKI